MLFMRPRYFLLFVWLFLSAILGRGVISAESPTATTRYVRLTGTDAGSCTFSSPCATVAYAKSQSFAGDTILVGKSTFDVGTFTQSAQIDFPLTIEGRFITLFPTEAWVACVGDNCPTFTPPANTNALRIFPANSETVTINNIIFADSSGASAVHVENGSVSFNNCTFNGNAHAGNNGGALFIDRFVSAEINNCTFTSNSARLGGALYALDGNITINNSSFQLNSATSAGGAIYHERDNLSVNDTLFQQNASGGAGGALTKAIGTATISASRFVTNSATTQGGAIWFGSATVTVDNTQFDGNNVLNITPDQTVYGGAISQSGTGLTSSGGTLTLHHVQVRQNEVSGDTRRGGGIAVRNGILTIENSTLADNKACTFDINGDGIWVEDATLTLADSTLTKHNCTSAIATPADVTTNITLLRTTIYGNARAFDVSSGTIATIANSTISGHSNTANVVRGTAQFNLTYSTVYNLGQFGSALNSGEDAVFNISNSIVAGTCTFNGANPTWDAASLHTDASCRPFGVVDVMLTPLGDYGGSTLSHHPLPGSPAIERGTLVDCLALPVDGEDQRGMLRPIGGACDVGAVEYAEAPTAVALQMASTADASQWRIVMALFLLLGLGTMTRKGAPRQEHPS